MLFLEGEVYRISDPDQYGIRLAGQDGFSHGEEALLVRLEGVYLINHDDLRALGLVLKHLSYHCGEIFFVERIFLF